MIIINGTCSFSVVLANINRNNKAVVCYARAQLLRCLKSVTYTNSWELLVLLKTLYRHKDVLVLFLIMHLNTDISRKDCAADHRALNDIDFIGHARQQCAFIIVCCDAE